MIYVTGDIHGEIKRFSKKRFTEQKTMTRDDIVIILGDFGVIWDREEESEREKYTLGILENRSYTTLFIDGNHENFDRLAAYPVKEWNGGLVHEIRPHVLHLMRAQIYTIEGKTCRKVENEKKIADKVRSLYDLCNKEKSKTDTTSEYRGKKRCVNFKKQMQCVIDSMKNMIQNKKRPPCRFRKSTAGAF